jgi:hypothetical protein
MACVRQTVKFSQDTCGGVYIAVTTPGDKTHVTIRDQTNFNINGLDVEGLRELVNGLANILSSVSARMYEFEIKPEHRQ